MSVCLSCSRAREPEKGPDTQKTPEKQKSNDDTPARAKCVTCHQREADVIFLPCAHKLVCRQCAGSAKSCRECGKDIKLKVDTKGKPLGQTPPQAAGGSNTTPSNEGKGHQFKVKDTVRITSDVRQLERQQRDHGGWEEDMAQAAGKVGTVMKVSSHSGGGLVVQFGQQYWIFPPDCCSPAPGRSPDFIPFLGLYNVFGIETDGMDDVADLIGKDLGTLLEESATFMSRPSSLRELFVALGSHNTGKVARLLEREPNVVHQTVCGAAGLHIAAFLGQTETVRMLVAKGANVNQAEWTGDSPLIRAIYKHHTGTARVLIGLGADVNYTNKLRLTPLHVAAMSNQVDMVQLLLQHRASVNTQDSKGQTALHIALSKDDTSPAIVDAILAVGDLNLKLTSDQKATVLHNTVHFKQLRAMEKILARDGSLLNAVMERRYTALHLAAQNNYIDALKILLRAGADANARAETGQTPLHLACVRDFRESAMVLVQHGADVNVADRDGDTPLHLCVGFYSGRSAHVPKDKGLELAKCLIQHGARTDVHNHRGKTPIDVAQVLVADGLRRFLRDGGGTPKKNQNADEISNTSPSPASASSSAKCVTCHQREADVIFLPCAHKLVCRQCAGSVKNCRECGEGVIRRVDTEGRPVEAALEPPSTAPASSGEEPVGDPEDCKVQ